MNVGHVLREADPLRNETVPELGADRPIPPYRMPEYVRLVDGGVADNSGLTALRRALSCRGHRPISAEWSPRARCAALSSSP